MKAVIAIVTVSALSIFQSSDIGVSLVRADAFGNGENAFNIEFVMIGNPGNAPDTTGYPASAGSVPYVYRMGKFEISEQMIDKANALGGLALTKSSHGPDKPASGMSWNQAARFVNWLNVSTGNKPAYNFLVQPGQSGYSYNANIVGWPTTDPGYNPNDRIRNSLAQYFLPSDAEWYKAAYYDPTTGAYYDYPTGSDTAPTAVPGGTLAGTAVYNGQPGGRADITTAGGLSPYGTMAQGGNVYEWEETSFDFLNGGGSTSRGIRGGDAFSGYSNLMSNFRDYELPEDNLYGFRVASRPRPGDYNFDDKVDADDYAVWQQTFGSTANLAGDGNHNSIVDAADYTIWRDHLGNNTSPTGAAAASPEPSTAALLVIGCVVALAGRRR